MTAQIRRKLRLLHRRITNLSKKVEGAGAGSAKVRRAHALECVCLR